MTDNEDNETFEDERMTTTRHSSNSFSDENENDDDDEDDEQQQQEIKDFYDLLNGHIHQQSGLKSASRSRRWKLRTFRKKYLNRRFLLASLRSRLPIIDWLPKYKPREHLLVDIVAGLTVGILNLPQSMAHAFLATLPPVNGLYMSLFPLLIYFWLGTSKQITIGNIAIVSLLTGEVIERMAQAYKLNLYFQSQQQQQQNHSIQLSSLASSQGSPLLSLPQDVFNSVDESEVTKYRIVVACSLSLLTGIIQIVLGISGLGIIASYFSDTFVSAYTCASAFVVLVSQLSSIFGIRGLRKFVGSFKIPKTLYELATHLAETNYKTLSITVACMLYLVAFKEMINPRVKKRFKVEFPSELLLVIVMTALSYYFDFSTNLGSDIVKSIPTGMPTPQLPDVSLFGQLIKDGLLIAIISFSISISLATLYSRKRRYNINPTQELYAFGTANIFSSFFSCYPSSGSLSRSSLLDSLGANSQFASLSSSLVTILVILWLGRMFESLPKDCLASIIVVALKNLLFQVKDLYFLWRPNKIEFITWLGTFLGVVIFDIDIGLVIGLTLSILVIVIKDQYVQIRTLVPYNDAYIDKCFVRSNAFKNHHSSESTEQAHEQQKQKLVHAKIFKIQNSIYFINCQSFQLKIYKKYGRSPLDLQRQQNFLQQPMNETSSNPTQHETRLAVSYNNDIESNDNSRSLLLENIILDFSAVNYVDTSGVKAIRQLIVDYKKVGVSVFICRFQHNFLRVLHGMNVLDDLNGHIYLAIDDALKVSLKKYSNSKNPNSNVINHHHHNNNN